MSIDPNQVGGRHRDAGGRRADRRLGIFELGYEQARRRVVEQLERAHAAAAEIPELEAVLAEIDYLTGASTEPIEEYTRFPHTRVEWGVLFSYMSAESGHVMPAFGSREDATAYAEHILANHPAFSFDLATRSAGSGEWHIVRTGRPVADILAERSAPLAKVA